MKKYIIKHLLACPGLSSDVVGVALGTIFLDIQPGAGFKTSDFDKKYMAGGATAERLKIVLATSAVSSTNLGSILMFASCVLHRSPVFGRFS